MQTIAQVLFTDLLGHSLAASYFDWIVMLVHINGNKLNQIENENNFVSDTLDRFRSECKSV